MKPKTYLKRCFRFEEKKMDSSEFRKAKAPYKITLEDLDEAFRNIIVRYNKGLFRQDFYVWKTYFVNAKEGEEYILPSNIDSKDETATDFYFKKSKSLLILGLNMISSAKDKEELKKFYETFKGLKGYIRKKRIPTEDELLKAIVRKMDYALTNIGDEKCLQSFNKEDLDLFRRLILKYSSEGDYDISLALAYQYYEGSIAFECDTVKAEELLRKLYEVREDPMIANTLGYIYYYDRNGKGERDKAFTQFSIGRNAGGYYESTYKLADCYLHGYGTPVSKKAAFRLVNDIYEDTKISLTKYGDPGSKFADVCIRLGKYYFEGIGTKTDRKTSYDYYLKAKAALRYRLDNINYIGDVGLGGRMFQNVKGYIKERETAEGKYYVLRKKLPESLQVYCCSIDDDQIKITEEAIEINVADNNYNIVTIPEIDFAKVQKKVRLKLILKKKLTEKEIRKLENIWNVDLRGDSITFEAGENEYFWKKCKIDKVLFEPEDVDLKKKYTLVEVTFGENQKPYTYLYKGEKENPCVVLVKTKYGQMEVPVTGIYKVYEDELTIPEGKLGIALDPK